MVSLSEFLDVKVYEYTRDKYPGYLEYIVKSTNVKKNTQIISYLERYSLFSSKFLNYQDFKKVCDMIIKDQNKTTKGLDKIRHIKEGMNSKRTEFN